ncbi:MAG: ATPase, T2SS/T4P/T4SS family [Nakamurella sp.]
MAAAKTALEHILDEVRELIRRRGMDPVADRRAARLLVDEVINHYEERVATSSLPPLLDRTGVARYVFDLLAGFGALQRFLDDPTIEEIWVNEPGRVFVARDGVSELTTVVLTAGEIRDLVERMLKPSGRRLDLSMPFVDALLPDGSRLHAVIPDITREHLSLNIRKFVVAANGLEDLVSRGTLTPHAAHFLEAAVASGLNIIVAGGTQAGKTTLLNTLINSIPARERVVTCEEVFELRPHLPDVVAMQTRQPNLEGHGEIRLRRLVKEALRMRPSRIIVGEVRQEECLDLLVALNSGLPGMCSVHANSAREAVVKLCTLPLLAGENVTAALTVLTPPYLLSDLRRRSSRPRKSQAQQQVHATLDASVGPSPRPMTTQSTVVPARSAIAIRSSMFQRRKPARDLHSCGADRSMEAAKAA